MLQGSGKAFLEQFVNYPSTKLKEERTRAVNYCQGHLKRAVNSSAMSLFFWGLSVCDCFLPEVNSDTAAAAANDNMGCV